MEKTQLSSKILQGWVRHRRFTPIEHALNYSLFMVQLNLSELDDLFKGNPFWSTKGFNLIRFKREDYFNPKEANLEKAVKDRVEETTGRRPSGQVEIVSHLRYFGHNFNPVSFYFCYEKGQNKPAIILAEITNTPWNERFHYLLALDEKFSKGAVIGEHKNSRTCCFKFNKAFHVSPFNPMDMQYHWNFHFGEKTVIHMDTIKDNEVVMDATMSMKSLPATNRTLLKSLIKFPGITMKVVWGIYWNAFKLWVKRFAVLRSP